MKGYVSSVAQVQRESPTSSTWIYIMRRDTAILRENTIFPLGHLHTG